MLPLFLLLLWPILIFIIFGILLVRLARLLGVRIFKFSEMYNFFQKLFKKSGIKRYIDLIIYLKGYIMTKCRETSRIYNQKI